MIFMDWKLHVIVSFLLYLVIILFFQFSLSYSVAAFILLVFSSLLPDLDHPKSLIRGVIFAVVFYLSMWFVLIELSADFMIKLFVIITILILTYYFYKNIPLKHRGKKSLHLWRYCFLVTGVSLVLFSVANINISMVSFIFIGYGSHLLADKIKDI